jgi:hypothetical protein
MFELQTIPKQYNDQMKKDDLATHTLLKTGFNTCIP